MELKLELIAAHLEGLEETIISKLIDRAQFCANPPAYRHGASGFAGATDQSLFDLRLHAQESIDAQFGRYVVPEERPFCTNLPAICRAVSLPHIPLHLADYNQVNLTALIRQRYFELLAHLCPPGDDHQYGSSVEHDVAALQAISRRIHFGAFYVAESKYREQPHAYENWIALRDRLAILAQLTRKSVEDAIIERVRQKVAYAQAQVNRKVRICIDPDCVLQFYRDTIIPLTKEGEIEYLLHRSPLSTNP